MKREQPAYDTGEPLTAVDVDEQIAAAMRSYLESTLGWRHDMAEQRIAAELTRTIQKDVVKYLLSQGIDFRGMTVLDLGAGLGGLSAEMVQYGAHVIAIEPGQHWRRIAAKNVRRFGGGQVIGGVGEHLPLRASSIDMVVSVQVLEHVEDPDAVIQEVYRVLRAGGLFYLRCENYLSFREPHYRIFWLPLMPKSIGAVYLRLRRRSPHFLLSAITYTTILSVRAALRRSGFVLQHDERIRAIVSSPDRIKTAWKRCLLKALASQTPRLAHVAARLLTTAVRLCAQNISEVATKPAVSSRSPSP